MAFGSIHNPLEVILYISKLSTSTLSSQYLSMLAKGSLPQAISATYRLLLLMSLLHLLTSRI